MEDKKASNLLRQRWRREEDGKKCFDHPSLSLARTEEEGGRKEEGDCFGHQGRRRRTFPLTITPTPTPSRASSFSLPKEEEGFFSIPLIVCIGGKGRIGREGVWTDGR